MRWTEISNRPQAKRFEILSEEMKLEKCDTQYIQTELPTEFCDEKFVDDEKKVELFKIYLQKMKNDFDQLRIGGFLRGQVDLFTSEYPADLLQTRSFDSLVKHQDHWWPRNQFYQGLIHFLVPHLRQVDLSSPVLIAGTNSDARTALAALVKMGFSRFNFVDVDIESCQRLTRELKKIYFSVKFEVTELDEVTQLPNIYSMGINTFEGDVDPAMQDALFYFNFLPKGAFWVETSPRPSSALANEANNFGFQVYLGLDLVAGIDAQWAHSVMECKIDQTRYRQRLAEAFVTG